MLDLSLANSILSECQSDEDLKEYLYDFTTDEIKIAAVVAITDVNSTIIERLAAAIILLKH